MKYKTGDRVVILPKMGFEHSDNYECFSIKEGKVYTILAYNSNDHESYTFKEKPKLNYNHETYWSYGTFRFRLATLKEIQNNDFPGRIEDVLSKD